MLTKRNIMTNITQRNKLTKIKSSKKEVNYMLVILGTILVAAGEIVKMVAENSN